MTRPVILLMLPEYRVDEYMGGIGVRALDLATAMALRADVTIICNQPTNLPHVPCGIRHVEDCDLRAEISQSDAVIFFDLGNVDLLRYAVQAGRYVVVENAVPLEHMEYSADLPMAERDARYKEYVSGFRAQVRAADHFLTRSEIERRLMGGVLAIEGRLGPMDVQRSPRLEHLITNVPIGICTQDLKTTTTAPPEPGRFLWTGGLWDYMAYEVAIEAFSQPDCLDHLCFLYRPPKAQPLRAHEAFANLAMGNGRLSFLDHEVPHTARRAVIERASGLVCIARPGIENETCVRLRVRDTLLYRRPIIVDLHGATGEYVKDTGIGLALADLSAHTLRSTLAQLRPDGDMFLACLECIDRERQQTLLEDHLDGFFQAGQACNWTPTRDKVEVLAGWNNVSVDTCGHSLTPFLT